MELEDASRCRSRTTSRSFRQRRKSGEKSRRPSAEAYPGEQHLLQEALDRRLDFRSEEQESDALVTSREILVDPVDS